MKKFLSLLLVLVLVGALLTGCASTPPSVGATTPGSTNPSPGTTAPSTPAPSAPAPAKATPAITLRFAHIQNMTSPLTKLFTAFCDKVNVDSKGAIKIEQYPASQLGNETEIADGISTNTLDLAQCPPAQGMVWDADHRISVLAMPTAFHSVEHLKKACESAEVASWMDNLAAKTNIRVLNIMLSGERHITSNKVIKTPADMVGLKFRSSSSANFVAFCNALGVKPTIVSMAEVYLGLQQGVIEAQENPIPTIMASKFYEVQKYLIKTGHTFQTIMVGASDKKWKTLTDEQRNIIQSNLKIIQDQSFIVIPEESVKGEKFLIEHGMTIIEPDKKAFYAAGEIMTDALVKEYGQEIRDAYDFVQSLDK